jgi:hypothetical protein
MSFELQHPVVTNEPDHASCRRCGIRLFPQRGDRFKIRCVPRGVASASGRVPDIPRAAHDLCSENKIQSYSNLGCFEYQRQCGGRLPKHSPVEVPHHERIANGIDRDLCVAVRGIRDEVWVANLRASQRALQGYKGRLPAPWTRRMATRPGVRSQVPIRPCVVGDHDACGPSSHGYRAIPCSTTGGTAFRSASGRQGAKATDTRVLRAEGTTERYGVARRPQGGAVSVGARDRGLRWTSFDWRSRSPSPSCRRHGHSGPQGGSVNSHPR